MRELYNQVNDPLVYPTVKSLISKIQEYCKNFEVPAGVPKGLNSAEIPEEYSGRAGHEEDEQSDHQELFLNSLLTRWQAAEEMEVAHEFQD